MKKDVICRNKRVFVVYVVDLL